MAKKRGTVSPLGNTAGSEEAIADSNKNQLESLAKRLRIEAEDGSPKKDTHISE